MTPFTDDELAYLASQRLGRLATVAADGQVQNNPVAFFVNNDAGTVDIGGFRMGATRKFRNVEATRHVAFVVDDLASVDPWWVRGVEVRGRAETLHDAEPPAEGFSRYLIRIRPERIISWGLDPKQQQPMSRRVPPAAWTA